MPVIAALILLCVACGSDTDGDPAAQAPAAESTRPVETAVPVTTSASDQALADAALLAPDDLEGSWRALPPEGDWPYSAEIAREASSCEPFAETVFGGGPQHAPSSTVTLYRDDKYLYAYVVVFPTSQEAETLMTAVGSPEFDDCWSQYMNVAALASAYEITEAHYTKDTPPEMTFDADSYVARKVSGTIEMDGAEWGDSCVCVFAQVGRAVVLVHSAAEQIDTEERVAATQTAIDKARSLVG